MFKKGIALCVGFSIICIGIVGWAQGKSPNRIASERLIAQIDFSSWIHDSFKVSPDSKRVAYGARIGNNRFVVVDGKEEKQCDYIGKGTPIFSPDSKRVAYVAWAGNKQFVVVDGKEEKQYENEKGKGGRSCRTCLTSIRVGVFGGRSSTEPWGDRLLCDEDCG